MTIKELLNPSNPPYLPLKKGGRGDFYITTAIVIVFSLLLSPIYISKANGQSITVLTEQINAVQRALVIYRRIHPEMIVSPMMAPTIDDLVQQGYLPITDDIKAYAGSLHLYTLWDGEIKVQANHYHLFIRVEKLPHKICALLLQQLQRTAPQSSCQGEVNDPLDWQLQIPLTNKKLFVNE